MKQDDIQFQNKTIQETAPMYMCVECTELVKFSFSSINKTYRVKLGNSDILFHSINPGNTCAHAC